ncbi:hypothetical protein E2320_014401, partial [Naja naja]
PPANRRGFIVRGPSCGGLCHLPFSAQVREATGSVPPFQPRAHPAQLEGRGSPGGSLQAVLNLRLFQSYNRACPQKPGDLTPARRKGVVDPASASRVLLGGSGSGVACRERIPPFPLGGQRGLRAPPPKLRFCDSLSISQGNTILSSFLFHQQESNCYQRFSYKSTINR